MSRRGRGTPGGRQERPPSRGEHQKAGGVSELTLFRRLPAQRLRRVHRPDERPSRTPYLRPHPRIFGALPEPLRTLSEGFLISPWG